MALIPPKYMDCVVAIGFRTGGGVRWVATGFLFGFHETERPKFFHLFLVSNRHVFENKSGAVVRFNAMDDRPPCEIDVDLTDTATGEQKWHAFPDESVDVGWIELDVYTFGQDFAKVHLGSFLEENVADVGLLQGGSVSEGHGVFILGFPMGMVGLEKNYVIARHGIIARILDALAGHSKSILIDASVFQGNSGGPVVLRPEPMSISGTESCARALLLGIVTEYLPYQDAAISQRTGQPILVTQENSGLANVVPFYFVQEELRKGCTQAEPAPNNSGT